MIVLRGIPFKSHCEHHVAPIIGRAWVAYVPTGRVVGISKLARVVEVYAKRLQIQEKMTAQIANTIPGRAAAAMRRRGAQSEPSLHVDPRHPQARHRHAPAACSAVFAITPSRVRSFWRSSNRRPDITSKSEMGLDNGCPSTSVMPHLFPLGRHESAG